MKLTIEPDAEAVLAQIWASSSQRIVLENVDWAEYDQLLHAFDEGQHHLRTTYDRGSLEIMTLSPEHEGFSSAMALLLQVLAEECAAMLKCLGSLTIRRADVKRGLEPDKCFYSQNYPKIRGKKRIDLGVDPPPDLAVEVDVTRSSLNRMAVYAQLGVPELWRFESATLKVYVLNAAGVYEERTHSRLFPAFAPAELMPFVLLSEQEDDASLAPKFRAWVRQQLGK